MVVGVFIEQGVLQQHLLRGELQTDNLALILVLTLVLLLLLSNIIIRTNLFIPRIAQHVIILLRALQQCGASKERFTRDLLPHHLGLSPMLQV